jgi:hypothetical protein
MPAPPSDDLLRVSPLRLDLCHTIKMQLDIWNLTERSILIAGETEVRFEGGVAAEEGIAG